MIDITDGRYKAGVAEPDWLVAASQSAMLMELAQEPFNFKAAAAAEIKISASSSFRLYDRLP
jgi:hypothetical protein